MDKDLDKKLIRLPSHAGSWYSDNAKLLDSQLTEWLSKTANDSSVIPPIKALIGPHAGFDYSGPTAAWGYRYLSSRKDLKVFLLGPCHHVYLKSCGITSLKVYRTPLGDIDIDQELVSELKSTGFFTETTKRVEEEEHSLEMHLPYIQKLLKGTSFKLVPIMVGNLDAKAEENYGALLAKYFDREDTVFIVSSDFCHWGAGFDFMYYRKEDGEIYQSIEKLDRVGMNLIQEHDFKGYTEYLEKTENTICGRHPIGVLINIILKSAHRDKIKTKFTQYAQSDRVKSKKGTSVSYASAVSYIIS